MPTGLDPGPHLSAYGCDPADAVTDIQSSAQTGDALRPIAGGFAFTVFALGISGTSFAIPPSRQAHYPLSLSRDMASRTVSPSAAHSCAIVPPNWPPTAALVITLPKPSSPGLSSKPGPSRSCQITTI